MSKNERFEVTFKEWHEFIVEADASDQRLGRVQASPDRSQ